MNGKSAFAEGGLPLIEFMELYDKLPPKIRKFFQDAPMNLVLSTGDIEVVRAYDEKVILASLIADTAKCMRQSTLETYGPEHPQA